MDKAEAMRIAASDATVSDKIRALDAAGYPRAEIAKLLDKRYQHVRNVLEGDKLRRDSPQRFQTGVAEPTRRFEHGSKGREVEDRGDGYYKLAVRSDGSVVLPPAVRTAFGIGESGLVMARLEGDEFKLISRQTAWRRIDELMQPYRWADGPLASEELIAERRAEARREADD